MLVSQDLKMFVKYLASFCLLAVKLDYAVVWFSCPLAFLMPLFFFSLNLPIHPLLAVFPFWPSQRQFGLQLQRLLALTGPIIWPPCQGLQEVLPLRSFMI